MRILVLALMLALASPAFAASCATVDDAIHDLTADPNDIEPYAVIDDVDAVKAETDALTQAYPALTQFTVSRLLVAVVYGKPYFGIEVGECLSRPMPWPEGLPFPLSLTKGTPA